MESAIQNRILESSNNKAAIRKQSAIRPLEQGIDLDKENIIMKLDRRPILVLAAVLAFSTVVWIGCSSTNTGVRADASASSGKVPITTKSDEAKTEFLQGRDLSEKLQGNDSLQHFNKAVTLDPDFATAELALANNSPTAKDFFDHLKKASSLADKASDGEKLFILANEAGANGDTVKQKDYLEKLIAAYPNDERARLALGNYYFGQQDYTSAIAQYTKATSIAPEFPPAYNILGYAYRQNGDYGNAEEAFKKYITLIPNDPNPYDSYAELLLKMGRFDESVAQYHKALSIDPHFAPSHFGIAADLMYQNKPYEANAELQTMADAARNDGELRTAFFGMAVVAADSGKFDKALQAMDKEFAVAQKKEDAANMAADLQAEGNILAQIPKFDEARKVFDRSLQLIESSNLSQEIKDNAQLQHHYNLASLAIGQKKWAEAKTHADAYLQGAEASKNAAQLKQAHDIAGRIAMGEKDYDKAITELQQSNLQNPQDLYRLSEAYRAKGDIKRAIELSTQAAQFNSLPALNYAFVRSKARKMAGQAS